MRKMDKRKRQFVFFIEMKKRITLGYLLKVNKNYFVKKFTLSL